MDDVITRLKFLKEMLNRNKGKFKIFETACFSMEKRFFIFTLDEYYKRYAKQ